MPIGEKMSCFNMVINTTDGRYIDLAMRGLRRAFKARQESADTRLR